MVTPDTPPVELLDGTPVFAGTRVPVNVVTASLDKGIPFERVRASYAFLTPELVDAARAYQLAHPSGERRHSIAEVHPDWAVMEGRVVRPPAAERWRGENAEALESSNSYVEEHGLSLARAAVVGLQEAIAGQLVSDDELDQALSVTPPKT